MQNKNKKTTKLDYLAKLLKIKIIRILQQTKGPRNAFATIKAGE